MKLILFLIGLCVQLHAPRWPWTASDSVNPVEIVVSWERYRGERRARINALYDRIAHLIEGKRMDSAQAFNQEKFVILLAWEELEALRKESDKEGFAKLKELQKLPVPKLQEEVAKQLKFLAIRLSCEQGGSDYVRAEVELDDQRKEFVRYYKLWYEFGAHLALPSLNFNSLEMMWHVLRSSIGSTFDKLDKLVYEYAKTLESYLFSYLGEKKMIDELSSYFTHAGARDGEREGPLVYWDYGKVEHRQRIKNVFHELSCAIEEGYLVEKKISNYRERARPYQNPSFSSVREISRIWDYLKLLRRGSDAAAFSRLKDLQTLQAPRLREEVTQQLKFLAIRFLCEGGLLKPADYLRADVNLNEDERRKFIEYYEFWFEFEACLIKPDDCKQIKDRRYGVNCGALRRMFQDLVNPSMQPSFDKLDKLVYGYAQTERGYMRDYSSVAPLMTSCVVDPAEIVIEWELFRGERRARTDILYDRVLYLIEEKRDHYEPGEKSTALQLAWKELKTLRKDTDERAFVRLRALEKLQDAPNPKLQKEVTKQLKLLAVRYRCEEGTQSPAAYLRVNVELNEHERREFVRYYELWHEFDSRLSCFPTYLTHRERNFNSFEMMWWGLKPPIGSTFDELDKLIYEYNHLKAKTLNGYFSNHLDKKKIREGRIRTDQYFKEISAQEQEDSVRILANEEGGRGGYWQKIGTVFNHLKAKTLNGYFSNYFDEKKVTEECIQRHVQAGVEDQEDPVRILANWERERRARSQKISTAFCVPGRVIFPGDKDERIACQESSSDLKCKWLQLISARKQSDAEAFTRLKDLQKLQRAPLKLQQEVTKQLKLLTIRFLCEKGQIEPADCMYADVDLSEDERRKFVQYYELRQEFEFCIGIAPFEREWNGIRYGVTYKVLKRMFDDLVRPTTESSFDELDRLVAEYAETVEGYSADFEQHLE
jgi:hypothetical protein